MPQPWWTPDNYAKRRPFLLARAAALQALRAWFAAQDFIEVETAALQVSPGNETHLHAFATESVSVDGAQRRALYLHTSPEFACKKLLAAGETRFFTLARVFRNREDGPLHAREFILLEWYRTGVALEALMDDCVQLVAVLAHSLNADGAVARCVERLSVAQALQRYAGVDLNRLIDDAGQWIDSACASAARALGLRVASDDRGSDIFSKILTAKIEPQLGQGALTFLTTYPMAEAALAKPSDADPRFAERGDRYMDGVEIANAFAELTDPAEQRARFTRAMQDKHRIYGEAYPLDEDFLRALAHMPPSCGIALGVERLVMLLTGAQSLRDVMWTP